MPFYGRLKVAYLLFILFNALMSHRIV